MPNARSILASMTPMTNDDRANHVSTAQKVSVSQKLLSREYYRYINHTRQDCHHRPGDLSSGASLAVTPRASLVVPPVLPGTIVDSAEGLLDGSLLFSEFDFSTSCSTAGVVVPGESSSRISPRSLTNTQRARQRAFKGAQKMNTALLALAYALAIASWS